MREIERVRNQLLSKKVIKGLESRNMSGYFVETKEDALAKALELIDEGSVVGWGGSMTINEIGLVDALENGNYTTLNRSKGKNQEEVDGILRACFSADYFLSSTNAITEDGMLVNIDGGCNRIAAIAFGPKKVIMIVGMNKVVKTEEDALSRARTIVAPINAQRFDIDTPCKTGGSCANCKSLATICCQFLTTRFSKQKDRIHVILVNDYLGI